MDLLELWRSEIDAECAVDLPELWKPQLDAFPDRIIDRYVLILDTLDGLPLRSTLTMPMRTSLVVTKPDGLYEAPIGSHMGAAALTGGHWSSHEMAVHMRSPLLLFVGDSSYQWVPHKGVAANLRLSPVPAGNADSYGVSIRLYKGSQSIQGTHWPP